MKRVSNWLALLAAGALGVLGGGALAASAPPRTAPAFVPLAHSALVTVDGTTDGGRLILRAQRTSDGAQLPGAQLQARLDGHALPLTPRADGTWETALSNLASSPDGALEITVAHDGLREILSGRFAGSARTPARSVAGAGAGFLTLHKQLTWWILNIVVVLIGVIAVSRRMS